MNILVNHKVFEIYGEENKSVLIINPKDVLVLRNGESNGVTLNDVFKKIDELEENKIVGWSILENYKPEEGFLVDSEGNKISLLQGEDKIFFKKVRDSFFIIKDEKEVPLDYVKDVSSLLGLGTIEETITVLTNEDKQILVEERMLANEKRQKQIKAEKEEADAKEKKVLEEERKKIEQEQAEEQERLTILEAEAEATKKREAEENEKLELEAKKKHEQEQLEKEKEEAETAQAKQKEKAQADAEKRKKEREKNENVYTPKQYRDMRIEQLKSSFSEYITEDEKYIFFFPQEVTDEDKPFVMLKTEDDYEELIDGELTINTSKLAEYEFKEGKEDKVIILNKKTESVKVKILA